MRFESVTAHPFGPFSDETLRFAPNMTVIHGPNESGKSSWHAVLYAAFCGIRRGGGLRKEDRAFADQHKPWTADAWEVSTVLTLNDGRRLELHHDLAGKVDCRATDAVLGRDVSAEIINDGSPDGSVWLGLNRRCFLATACVRQTDLLSILEDPDLLQEHLQRAAATSGVGSTAAGAISRLEGFRKERVGPNRINSIKPLARTLERVARAKDSLENAVTLHDEFLRLSSQAEQRWSEREGAARKLRTVEAAVAARLAGEWEARAVEAQELLELYPAGPPVGGAEDDDLAQGVASALGSWQERPRPGTLEGSSSSELRKQLANLPEVPKGDRTPHPAVLGARDAYLDAERALDLHERVRPLQTARPETGGLSEEDLRGLAGDLEATEPTLDPSLQERVAASRMRVEEATKNNNTPILTAGVISAVAGGAALVLGVATPGLLLLVAGGLLVVLALTRGRGTSRLRALEELREAENLLGERRHSAEKAKKTREAARSKCSVHGLSPDPAVLRGLANALSESERSQHELKRWIERHESLLVERGNATSLLVRALSERGEEPGSELRQSIDRYVEACSERARLAEQASRRQILLGQLEAREAAEKIIGDAQRARTAAEEAVRDAAARCGVTGDEVEELVRGLEDWQRRRKASLQRQQKAREDWLRLESLLGGLSIEELKTEAIRHRNTASRLGGDARCEGTDTVVLEPDVEAQLARLRQFLERVSAETARLEGQVDEQARRLPSVPEAEEELASAERQLDEIRRLDATLKRTLVFLERAEEKVHRDIAPVLAESVSSWIPKITSDRYVDARVDPDSLTVRVRGPGGAWRDAVRLSHGTAEQVYLLLRIAVAEHLTKPGETCPLILDDVTAQFDEGRTGAVLDMLHRVSETRQVILFSQEREVFEWAQKNLQVPQDRLEILSPEVIGA